MGNSDDNGYSREFVDGVIRDYQNWKKRNTTDPDADNANDNQRITGYKVISAANSDDTPANNNQGAAGDEVMTAENPASSSEDATRQQPAYRDAIIGNAQNVMPVKEYINASRIEDSGDGLTGDKVMTPGTTASTGNKAMSQQVKSALSAEATNNLDTRNDQSIYGNSVANTNPYGDNTGKQKPVQTNIDPYKNSKGKSSFMDCTHKCIRDNYGASYDTAWQHSPFSLIDIAQDIYNDVTLGMANSAIKALPTEAARTKGDILVKMAAANKASRKLGRLIPMTKVLSGLNTANNLLGALAGGYVAGANIYCGGQCAAKEE